MYAHMAICSLACLLVHVVLKESLSFPAGSRCPQRGFAFQADFSYEKMVVYLELTG
jgi:hypothetical protein